MTAAIVVIMVVRVLVVLSSSLAIAVVSDKMKRTCQFAGNLSLVGAAYIHRNQHMVSMLGPSPL